MNRIVILQARMGSSRLPGKVLMPIDGKPTLLYQLERIAKSKQMTKCVVATSNLPQDDAIEKLCKDHDYECFRGSETDVLSRYYHCAKQFNAEIIIRLTGDCPLIDPHLIDEMIEAQEQKSVAYYANTVPPETAMYPDGSDIEIFTMNALERAFNEAKSPADREHVTFYFWKGDNGFITAQHPYTEDLSSYRFTVDYPEDLEVISFLIEKLKGLGLFGHLDELTQLLDANPSMKGKNSMYEFGAGWQNEER